MQAARPFGRDARFDREVGDYHEPEHHEGDGAHGPGEPGFLGELTDHDRHDHTSKTWESSAILGHNSGMVRT